MTKTVEGLNYYGEYVTANIEFQVPFKYSWVIDAYFEDTGIYLTEIECLELLDKNFSRIHEINRELEGSDE